jgi:hypothetical protein
MSGRHGKRGSPGSLQYAVSLLKTRKQELFNGTVVEQSTQDAASKSEQLIDYSPKGAFKGVQLDYPAACILCGVCDQHFPDRLDPKF